MRVVVSPPTEADEAAFLDAMRRSRRRHGRWTRMPETPEAYAEYLAKGAVPHRAYFLARLRESGDIVGFLNLGEIIRGSLQGGFLGYGGVEGHAGKGLMSEAMQLVLREALVTLKLHRIEANIQPGNAPSIALARGAGFRLEGYSPRYLLIGGRWRDHERYAITADEHAANRAER